MQPHALHYIAFNLFISDFGVENNKVMLSMQFQAVHDAFKNIVRHIWSFCNI